MSSVKYSCFRNMRIDSHGPWALIRFFCVLFTAIPIERAFRSTRGSRGEAYTETTSTAV